MSKMMVEYKFVEINDEDLITKTVAVQVGEPDTDNILAAFIDFCNTIGIELKMDYTVPSSGTSH